MTDAVDMTEEQLDAAIFNNPSEHDTSSESGQGDDTSVSPLDDAEGQPAEGEEITDVDQSSEQEVDLDSSLSTEETKIEGEEEKPDAGDEPANDNLESPQEGEAETDNEPIAFQPLRADGKEYPIDSIEELYTLASKGINANKKWDESAEGRKIQQTMSKNDITMDDINALIEMKGGSKDAIMSLMKQLDINPLDMDADAFNGDYKPKDYTTGDFEMALDDVMSRIKTQPRYDETVNVIMDKWDEKSRQSFYQDPKLMELLNIDMQVDPNTGTSMYDKVSPLADKLKALGSGEKTDLEYYMEAGKRVIGGMKEQEATKAEATKAAKAKEVSKKNDIAKKKKAAASSGGQTAGQKPVDVSEMSDDELDAYLAATN